MVECNGSRMPDSRSAVELKSRPADVRSRCTVPRQAEDRCLCVVYREKKAESVEAVAVRQSPSHATRRRRDGVWYRSTTPPVH